MDPLSELDSFWNWLPVFRAVAESESLTDAAQRLGMSASSLSRTLRLLEKSLGRELFVRTDRALRPNAEGEALLQGVRRGMRSIHASVTELQSPEPHGVVRISCTGLYVDHLPPLLDDVCRRYPRLHPELLFVPTAEVASQLLRGDLDVAICTSPSSDDGLEIEPLDQLSHGVYCGPAHPLADVEHPTVAQILAHRFVGPPRSTPGADHWPTHLRRDVALRVHQVAQATAVCAIGRFLAFLPRSSTLASTSPLRRLGFEEPVQTRVYALRREDVVDRHPARLVVEALRDRIRQGSISA
ncbi:MAG: LysR family transcriptional regulator [Planctomycetes bacterium]|nr:LysR family transcriptional regulator [Planctomycetota bacterium]